jgi:anaerobic C4-dicarboxylate transporter
MMKKAIFHGRVNLEDGLDCFKLTQETKMMYSGATKFYKRSFIGESRRSDKRIHGDIELYCKLLEKKPIEKFTDIVFYHYNFPREGGLITYVYLFSALAIFILLIAKSFDIQKKKKEIIFMVYPICYIILASGSLVLMFLR